MPDNERVNIAQQDPGTCHAHKDAAYGTHTDRECRRCTWTGRGRVCSVHGDGICAAYAPFGRAVVGACPPECGPPSFLALQRGAGVHIRLSMRIASEPRQRLSAGTLRVPCHGFSGPPCIGRAAAGPLALGGLVGAPGRKGVIRKERLAELAHWGRGRWGTGDIWNGKIWHNKSVPNCATVFEGPKAPFQASFLAHAHFHIVPNSLQEIRATVQRPLSNTAKQPKAHRKQEINNRHSRS